MIYPGNKDLIVHKLLYIMNQDKGSDKKCYYEKQFDHKKFWLWCEEKAEQGHIVYVSEKKTCQRNLVLF